MNRSCNAHPEPFSAHAGEDVQILVGPPFGRDLRSRIAPRASIKFLADAFAVWCDQKSRLAGARAPEVRRGAAADSENAVLDDDGHAALAEAYARTREVIGALLARAEAARARPEVRCEAAADTGQSAPRPSIANGASGSLGGPDSYQIFSALASLGTSGGPQTNERTAAEAARRSLAERGPTDVHVCAALPMKAIPRDTRSENAPRPSTARAGEPPEGRRSDGVGAKRPSTWEGEPPGEPPRARNCPAC